MKNNESGRSMIEMLGVLAIIGVLSVGGIAGYSKAMTKFKTNKVSDQVSTIVTNLRTLYAQQMNYTGLNNKTAIQMGVIPEEMGMDANTGLLKNPFNGTVYIGAGRIGKGISGQEDDRRAFVIEYNGLPRAACVSLATSDWGSNSSSGLIGIKAIGSVPAVATGSTPDAVVDVTGPQGLEFQDNGAPCTGIPATSGSVVACSGGNYDVPIPVAQAAIACNCGTANSCTVVWKYF